MGGLEGGQEDVGQGYEAGLAGGVGTGGACGQHPVGEENVSDGVSGVKL